RGRAVGELQRRVVDVLQCAFRNETDTVDQCVASHAGIIQANFEGCGLQAAPRGPQSPFVGHGLQAVLAGRLKVVPYEQPASLLTSHRCKVSEPTTGTPQTVPEYATRRSVVLSG